jgi:hypothetical protein
MFYAGKHHLLYDESESGKSWLAQAAAAEELRAGEHVLYLDFEADERSVVGRLLALGVRPHDVAALFHYVNPASRPRGEEGTEALRALLSVRYGLVVVDGVTEGIALYGLSPRDESEVAAWYAHLPEQFARKTGAPVVSIDHVSHGDGGARGRFALGSQHKVSGLSGAGYLLDEVRQPFGRGRHGIVRVFVTKDRPGYVRGRAGLMRSNRTQLFAEFHLISTADGEAVEWALRVPQDSGAEERGPERPTWYMEAISRHVEDAGGSVASKAVIEAAIKAEREAADGRFRRNACRKALDLLIDEGYLAAGSGHGRDGRAHRIESLKPYRQNADAAAEPVVERLVMPKPEAAEKRTRGSARTRRIQR